MYRTIFYFVLSFAVAIGAVVADEQAIDLARNRYFHLNVTGKDVDGNTVERAGKAFAIAPDILITARHVVGDIRDWSNKGSPDGVILPHRSVVMHWMERDSKRRSTYARVYITSIPVETVDAAKITIVRLSEDRVQPMKLSAGDPLDRSGTYRVLLVNETPKSGESIEFPILRELRPAPYATVKYGGMEVFEMIGSLRKIVSGDSGSPVVNEDMEVVGFVSGVAEDEVLVTMLSSFFQYIR